MCILHAPCCDFVVLVSTSWYGMHPLLTFTFFITAAYIDDEAPKLEDMCKLREHESTWWFICDKLLPAVVGTHIWDRKSVVDEVSDFVTVSDVAFCLLSVENNWDYWVEIATPAITDRDNEGQSADIQKITGETKWTSSNLVAGKNAGWSEAGLQRFNDLCTLEAENRDQHRSVEKQYLKKKKERDAVAYSKQRRNSSVGTRVRTYVDVASLGM